jgi:hypothetical protein
VERANDENNTRIIPAVRNYSCSFTPILTIASKSEDKVTL